MCVNLTGAFIELSETVSFFCVNKLALLFYPPYLMGILSSNKIAELGFMPNKSHIGGGVGLKTTRTLQVGLYAQNIETWGVFKKYRFWIWGGFSKAALRRSDSLGKYAI